jgi:hypothetical protein
MGDTRTVTVRRTWLALLTGLTAVSAAAGAIGLATGTSDPGDAITARLPWHSVVLAGFALLVVVAAPMAVASWLAAREHRAYPVAAAGAGALLVGWIALEIAVIREFSWLQVVFTVVGVAVLVLAAAGRNHRVPWDRRT